MTLAASNNLLLNWLLRPRQIKWCFVIGLKRKTPNITGEFITTLHYLDDQGEKWGDTYIKIVGQHYEDYAYWNAVKHLLPVGGSITPTFVPAPFRKRQYKSAAPGVTGLIGEVLITNFFQKEFNLSPFDMAHLMDNRKAPDLCLDIEPQLISNMFRNIQQATRLGRIENSMIANIIARANWPEPLPVECKSRRQGGDRQLRSALLQLLEYWRQIPSMAGYGIYAQVDIFPETLIKFHLILPKLNEIDSVRQIITGRTEGTTLPELPIEPTVKEFNEALGGKILG